MENTPPNNPNTSPKKSTNPPVIKTKKFGMGFFFGTFSFLGVLFGGLITMLVINAKQAGISHSFISQIGIDPAQIQSFLLTLVNSVFGILGFIFFLVLLTYLFRVLFLKTEERGEAVKLWMVVIFWIAFLAVEIFTWMFLYRMILGLTLEQETNINARIIITDTEIEEKIEANNLTAPITLSFDAKQFERRFVQQDKTILSYSWDLDGDGEYEQNEIGNPINRTFNTKGDNNGVFPISLKMLIRDNASGESTWQEKKDIETVTISAIRPVIEIRIPQPAEAPATVLLDASRSFDADATQGSKLKFEWFVNDILQDEKGSSLQYNCKEAGDYSIRLVVTDLDNNSTEETFTYTALANRMSQVEMNIEASSETGAAPFTPIFKTNVFTPPNMRIVNYEWNFGDGSIPEVGKVLTHTFKKEGKYTVLLTISDDEGNIKETSKEIVVRRQSPSPKIFLQTEPTYETDPKNNMSLTGNAPFKVLFDAARTTDPDDNIASYEWDFDNNGDYDMVGSKIYNTFYEGGIFTTKLRVKDNDENESIQFITITVVKKEVNASITANKLAGEIPLDVEFDGSGSVSSKKPIIAYLWDFGDGVKTSTQNARIRHTYTKEGIFRVELTIKTQDGKEDKDSTEVIVSKVIIKSSFSASRSGGEAPLTVSFDATGSKGSITRWEWDFDDGDTEKNKTFLNHTFTTPGTYKVKLRAYDESNNYDEFYKTIIVK
jgi:PKD repeat protein